MDSGSVWVGTFSTSGKHSHVTADRLWYGSGIQDPVDGFGDGTPQQARNLQALRNQVSSLEQSLKEHASKVGQLRALLQQEREARGLAETSRQQDQALAQDELQGLRKRVCLLEAALVDASNARAQLALERDAAAQDRDGLAAESSVLVERLDRTEMELELKVNDCEELQAALQAARQSRDSYYNHCSILLKDRNSLEEQVKLLMEMTYNLATPQGGQRHTHRAPSLRQMPPPPVGPSHSDARSQGERPASPMRSSCAPKQQAPHGAAPPQGRGPAEPHSQAAAPRGEQQEFVELHAGAEMSPRDSLDSPLGSSPGGRLSYVDKVIIVDDASIQAPAGGATGIEAALPPLASAYGESCGGRGADLALHDLMAGVRLHDGFAADGEGAHLLADPDFGHKRQLRVSAEGEYLGEHMERSGGLPQSQAHVRLGFGVQSEPGFGRGGKTGREAARLEQIALGRLGSHPYKSIPAPAAGRLRDQRDLSVRRALAHDFRSPEAAKAAGAVGKRKGGPRVWR